MLSYVYSLLSGLCGSSKISCQCHVTNYKTIKLFMVSISFKCINFVVFISRSHIYIYTHTHTHIHTYTHTYTYTYIYIYIYTYIYTHTYTLYNHKYRVRLRSKSDVTPAYTMIPHEGAISFTPWAIYPWRTNPLYEPNNRLGEPQSQLGCFRG